jgi:hypothetical protein
MKIKIVKFLAYNQLSELAFVDKTDAEVKKELNNICSTSVLDSIHEYEAENVKLVGQRNDYLEEIGV